MDPARWRQIETLFNEAISQPLAERAAFLQNVCGTDAELHGEVSRMLRADQTGSGFLDRDLADVSGALFDSLERQRLLDGSEIGPYRLERPLGEGGMGVVWLARRSDTGGFVAIKLLLHARWSEARRQRFANEIRTLAKLNHQSIARLYDAGSLLDGTPWFAMEYVDGLPLDEYCVRNDLPAVERLKLFQSVCEAVQYAHSQEIIHRDLKPSNILVGPDGQVKLLDFGIARELHGLDETAGATRPGLRMMTPEYAAPEWMANGTLGFFTDVYSLGIVLYRLLHGHLPARGYAPGKAEIELLCAKAIELDHSRRYSSVEALARDVGRYLNHEPLEARPYSISYRIAKFVVRNRRAVAISACGLAIALYLLVAFSWRLASERSATLAEAKRTKAVEQFLLGLLEGGDKTAGPSNHLQVVTLLDRGVNDAQKLASTPAVQAEVYRTLGRSYQELGEFDKAARMLDSSLRMTQSVFGEKSVESAQALHDAGILAIDRGRFDDAEAALQKAFHICQTLRDDSALATAASALGRLAYERGDNKRAIELLISAVDMQTKIRPNSADLAASFGRLSEAYLHFGDYPNADLYGQKAMALHTQLFGALHPSVAEDLGMLGNAQTQWSHYGKAEEYFRRSFEIYRKYYGEEHPRAVVMLGYVAQSLGYQDRNREAEKLFQKVLQATENIYGTKHQKVALALIGLASAHVRLGKSSAAIEEDSRALDIYRSIFGDEHEYTVIAFANLATVYLETKKYAKAEPLFRKAVMLFSKIQSPTHLNTGIVRMKLGRALLGLRRYREAEIETRASYEILTKLTAPTNAWIQADRRDLVREYNALGKREKAARYQIEFAANEHP